MNRPLIAKALARGVEVAALTPFAEFDRILKSRESISDVVVAERSDSFATYELLAVQQLEDAAGRSIEVRVLASDGSGQLTAYYYARPGAPDVSI